MPVVYDGDFPDPYLLRVADGWYGFATQAGGRNVQVMHSTDLRGWRRLGDALPELPRWARPGATWSPAVLARGAGFVLYFVARHAREGRQAIGRAYAERPFGPFAPYGDEPFAYQRWRGGSIDPDPFVDVDGSAYLLWKSDDNAVGRRTSLWARRLTPDGLGWGGRAVRLLRADRDSSLVEAPSMAHSGAGYHLFYSAGAWASADYAIGHAIGPTATGPFRRTAPAWLRSSTGRLGPGGQCVVADSAGLLLAYHSWGAGPVGYRAGGRRVLHVDRLDLTGEIPRLVDDPS